MKGLYKIILLIIIPLLVAFGIGSFAYNNNTAGFLPDYISKAGYKNTEGETERYLTYFTSAFEKYYSKEVTIYNEEQSKEIKLFDLDVYRWFDFELNSEDAIDTKTVQYKYAYVLSNINYGNVYYSIYERSDKNHRFEYLPTFELTINDLGDEDEEKRDTNTTAFADNSDAKLNDYNFVGYTDDEGEETKRTYSGVKISTPSTKWASIEVDTKFTNNVEVIIEATDSQYPSEDGATIEVAKFELTDYNQKAKDLTGSEGAYKYANKDIVTGLNENMKKAGYFGYAFTHHIWWQSLIAIVLSLVVTGSTVLVWEDEARKAKEAQAKKTNKNNKK